MENSYVEKELIASSDSIDAKDTDQCDMLDKIHLGKLWQWATCFCAMDFDMDKGPSLETIFPPIELSNEEKKSLAFFAFPDSNTNDHLGDSQFSFKIKCPKEIQKIYVDSIVPDAFKTELGLPIDNDGMIYGHVFFRMKRDSNRKRGFFQVGILD